MYYTNSYRYISSLLIIYTQKDLKNILRFCLFCKVAQARLARFPNLIKLFPKISYATIKEQVFIGPDIRKLSDDNNFTKCLSATEKVTTKGKTSKIF